MKYLLLLLSVAAYGQAIVNAPAIQLDATGAAAVRAYLGTQRTGVTTVLTAPVLIGDSVITVDAVAGVTVGATIIIGSEHMSVTAKSVPAKTLTVTRAFNGTAAAAYEVDVQVAELRYRTFNMLAGQAVRNLLRGIVADYAPLSATIATVRAERDAALAAAQATKTAAIEAAVQ